MHRHITVDERSDMSHPKTVLTATSVTATMLALAACGGGEAGGESAAGGDTCDSIRVAEIIVSNYPEEQRQWQRDTAEAFEAETGTAIEFETMASAADEQTLIQTSVVSNSGPDVFAMGTTFVPVAEATGAFVVLSDEDWDAVGGRERFFEGPLGMSGRTEEEQIAVPYVMRPFGMVYNTELFAAAGIDGPPETWDQYIEYAEQLSDPAAARYATAVAYSDGFDPWKFIWMWTLQNGGELISEDLQTARLDSDEVVEAVKAYFGLLTDHQALDPRSVEWEAAQVQAAFANGELAMAAMTTPTWVPALESGTVAGKYAFAPHPLVPPGADELPEGGQPAGTIVSGDMLAIASYSDCKASALQYVDYVTGVDAQKNYYDIFGSIPANQEAAEELAADNPTVQAFVDATDDSVPTSFTGAWGNVQLGLTNVVTQSLADLQNGTYDEARIRELLAEANATVQRDLDRQSDAG
jgi:multiple sugar transport system substrate-binding protein